MEQVGLTTPNGKNCNAKAPCLGFCLKKDVSEFDYSAFEESPAIMALKIFHCFICVISFPTLCAAAIVEQPRKKSSQGSTTFRSQSSLINV
jgi:hypothetical protein